MTICGVELNHSILEAVQTIKDLNESNWTCRTLGKVMKIILDEGCSTEMGDHEKLKLISALHNLKEILQCIRHPEIKKE